MLAQEPLNSPCLVIILNEEEARAIRDAIAPLADQHAVIGQLINKVIDFTRVKTQHASSISTRPPAALREHHESRVTRVPRTGSKIDFDRQGSSLFL